MPLAQPTGVTISGAARAGEHPVVLIHPLAADRSIWRDVVAALEPRCVVTFDAPGHGSDAIPDTPWTISDLGNQLAGLMDAEGIERAIVAGMSLGGTAALQFALDHPGRVAGIVAADCVAHYPDDVAAVLRSRADEARTSGMSAIADTVLATWFTPDARQRAPEILGRARAAFVATPADSYAMAVDALIGTDLRRRIPRIGCPTLLVCGRDDLPAMREAAVSMAGDIGGARLQWLAGAHAAPIEHASEFARMLADFVATVDVGARRHG
jgi:3-oxoadipate enol-lactonase